MRRRTLSHAYCVAHEILCYDMSGLMLRRHDDISITVHISLTTLSDIILRRSHILEGSIGVL